MCESTVPCAGRSQYQVKYPENSQYQYKYLLHTKTSVKRACANVLKKEQQGQGRREREGT